MCIPASINSFDLVMVDGPLGAFRFLCITVTLHFTFGCLPVGGGSKSLGEPSQTAGSLSRPLITNASNVVRMLCFFVPVVEKLFS